MWRAVERWCAKSRKAASPSSTPDSAASAKQGFLPRLVDLRRETEAAGVGIAEPRDRPAGQDTGERLDIPLRVAAVDAERVQLENLAAEFLVDALGGAPTDRRVRGGWLDVV